jgi:integrase
LAIDKIGRERLASVDLLMCDTMLAAFAKQGYKNVGQMRMVLRQAFEYAFDNDYIHKNPFQKAVAPRTKHRKAQALTERQRTILLSYAAQADATDGMPLEPLWHLESRLAFRRGEALGLRWSDVDFKNATITIRQQRTTVGNRTITKDAPKGDKDGDKIRTVPVYVDILEMLQAFRSAQTQRAANDPDWVVTNLVFVGEHGRAPAANRVNKRLAKLVDRANAVTVSLPNDLHPHDLRHTALFLLEQAGVAPSIRMALGGHSTASMALHYIDHASVEDVRKALERIAG